MSDASRKAILDRLKARKINSVELPEVLNGNWIQYPDPVSQLKSVIEMVGGAFELVKDVAAVLARLESFPQMKAARRVLSLVDGIPNHVDLQQVNSPRDLEDLDFVVAPGVLAVAENGAVWVTDEKLRHRVAYYINQHLVLVVRRETIVHNMHEAYSRLKIGDRKFGCFISGPSKTADIEQSLVIGAHGCRSMQLYVVEEGM